MMACPRLSPFSFLWCWITLSSLERWNKERAWLPPTQAKQTAIVHETKMWMCRLNDVAGRTIKLVRYYARCTHVWNAICLADLWITYTLFVVVLLVQFHVNTQILSFHSCSIIRKRNRENYPCFHILKKIRFTLPIARTHTAASVFTSTAVSHTLALMHSCFTAYSYTHTSVITGCSVTSICLLLTLNTHWLKLPHQSLLRM